MTDTSGISGIVLISTYWNVNDVIIIWAGTNDFVLISTYWNVN